MSSSFPLPRPTLLQQCLAELIGTFLLVFFGLGAVHAAVLLGAQSGLWQVAIVWGVAIMLAIYTVGGISGAHINPAMTLAFFVYGRCAPRQVIPYLVSQLAGAIAAAAVLFCLFGAYLTAREEEKGVYRGKPGSEVTAMCYGEYFPNPGELSTSKNPYSADEHLKLRDRFPESRAILAEALGTLILALVVFAVTDPRNTGRPAGEIAPVFIGLTVSILISVIAPLTQACFNPARDFGPRLFAYFAGWREIALPGPTATGWWTVYIAAPICGALVGATLYEKVLRKAFAQ